MGWKCIWTFVLNSIYSRVICNLDNAKNWKTRRRYEIPFSSGDGSQKMHTFCFFYPLHRPWACLSNLLDPRYRGEKLGAERRRDTIEFMMKEDWHKVMGDMPKLEMSRIMDFLAKEGKFATASVWIGPDCIPSVFWAL